MFNFKQNGLLLKDSRDIGDLHLREFIRFIRSKTALFKELINFIRPETCLFISGIAVSGYLIFNGFHPQVIFLILAIFFSSGAGYAYNYISDKNEDLINNNKLNFFVSNKAGKLVIVGLISVGLLASMLLSLATMVFFLVWITSGLMYSLLRVKEIFLLKNIYTGAQMALTFALGAFADSYVNADVLIYIPFFFLIGFILNILGDIKGCEGDRVSGVKTIPVLFGRRTAKRVINFTILLFSFSTFIFGLDTLYFMIPFMFAMFHYLRKNDLRSTRRYLLSSQICFPIYLILM